MASKPRAHGDRKSVENDQRPPAGDQDFAKVVAEGDYRAQLERLRDELVAAFEQSPPGAKAQTAAQLRAVLKDLDALPKEGKVTVADDLARKRKDRRAAAEAAARAAGSGN